MNSCDILIDANIALHFPRIDQLDWPGLTGCRTCTIAIAPILLRELEEKKIFGATPAIKERAGRTIDYLVAKMAEKDPINVRPDVALVFLEHEPGIDFEANLLVREVNDDQYIASAIEHAAKTGNDTRIASNDGGMALKLRSRPVAVVRLPDELRLPLEQDPRDKELREAKAQLVQLQTQRPKLATNFAGGLRKREVRNAKALPARIATLDEIKSKHAPLPLPAPKQNDSPRSTGDIAALSGLHAAFGAGSQFSVERYNDVDRRRSGTPGRSKFSIYNCSVICSCTGSRSAPIGTRSAMAFFNNLTACAASARGPASAPIHTPGHLPDRAH